MTLERLIRERERDWSRLESLVAAAGGRAERLGAEGVLELGTLYRGAAADLAIARASFPTDPVRRRLEALVSRAALLVYDPRSRRESVLGFFTDRYWRRVAERPVPLLLAALLLLVPAVMAAVWAAQDPDAAAGFVPSEFSGAADPPADAGTTSSQEAAFSVFLFTHNIQVTFLVFAAGIAAGLGTAFVLVQNGLILGAIAGLAVGAGNGPAFVDFIVPHGPLELTCIIVSAAAGLRLGFSLIDPGDRTRGDALKAEALSAVEIVLGTMPWLVAAGISEAFVRSSGIPTAALVAVGVGLFAIYWGLVVWRGWLLPRRVGDSPAAGTEPAPLRAGPTAAPAPSR